MTHIDPGVEHAHLDPLATSGQCGNLRDRKMPAIVLVRRSWRRRDQSKFAKAAQLTGHGPTLRESRIIRPLAAKHLSGSAACRGRLGELSIAAVWVAKVDGRVTHSLLHNEDVALILSLGGREGSQ
jgi:hypothetical protein